MDIRTFTELTPPDERSLRFTPLGLATGGMLSPENAAEFQQRSIAPADLVPAVPEGTRSSFERLRTLHAYGVLCYDLFTVVDDLAWVVLEQALRERFVEFYGGMIPLVGKNGAESVLLASDFEMVNKAFRQGGSHTKGGWQLQLRTQEKLWPLPLTLGPLLRWAHQERLLHRQRNRRVEEDLFDKIRNRFAHGGGFRVGMPNQSARRIRELAEIINRLWGVMTPGGRLYPAPLQRDVLVIGWSPTWPTGEEGSSLVVIRAEQLAEQTEPDDWMYLVVLGVWDDRLWEFDARYELTMYPADLLWGPGTRRDALAWLEATAPVGDEVDYLDRVFAVRRHDGKVDPPYRASVLLGLPAEHRAGAWHVVRADFPGDCFAHVSHIEAGKSCGASDQFHAGCAVQEIAQGSWADAAACVRNLFPGLQAATYLEARVPRRWPLDAEQ
jgi:hypothetical protein